MKKNLKVISLAAAALLAVSPVAELGLSNNVQTVQAASDRGSENNPYSLSISNDSDSLQNDSINVDGQKVNNSWVNGFGGLEGDNGQNIPTATEISGLKPNQYYQYTDNDGTSHIGQTDKNGFLKIDGILYPVTPSSHESSQTPSTSDNNEESTTKQPTSSETSKSETTTTPSQSVQKTSDTTKQVANNSKDSEKSENSSKSTSVTTSTSSSISKDNQKTVASSVTKTTKKAVKKAKYVRVYNARGKAIKKHGKYVLVKASATRHAKIVKIRGKKYYKIGKNKYVLVSNQKTKKQAKKHVRKARRNKKNVRRHVKRTRRSKKSKRVNKKR